MNRNVESHFALLPHANVQRSIFDRSSSHKTSFNAGRLIPFYIDEVLPGDTFDITTSKVVRAQTMLAPIMDDLYLDTYWFFVPNRLVWEHWEEFCGENKKGPWAQEVEYQIPRLLSPAADWKDGTGLAYPFNPGTLADYFGLPVAAEKHSPSTTVNRPVDGSFWNKDTYAANPASCPSVLPFRGYALICNEFFRDENLTSPLLIPLDDANQTGSNDDNDNLASVACGGMPYKVAKYHDYFTSCLPSPQKGKEVSMPITFQNLPVVTAPDLTIPNMGSVKSQTGEQLWTNGYPLVFGASDTALTTGTPLNPDSKAYWNLERKYVVNSTPSSSSFPNGQQAPWVMATAENAVDDLSNHNVLVGPGASSTKASVYPLMPLNLQVDGSASAAGFTINNFRLAVAMQSFLEALARGGSRYGEMIASIFGVQNPDARLQRPEYLGGNRIPLNVSQVSNTAQTAQDPLGDVGAQSATSDVHSDFVKSFTEHGYLFGLCCVRYKHSYPQGLEKFWSRQTFTDFYNPKFANLGEVPVYTREIFNPDGDVKDNTNVFGYQEIWADYRYKPDRVSGEMRPKFAQTLAYWHLADNYSKAPTLSDEWIREDASIVDRVLAVTSSVSNQFWADFYVQCKCTRAMPMYSIPALEPRF